MHAFENFLRIYREHVPKEESDSSVTTRLMEDASFSDLEKEENGVSSDKTEDTEISSDK